MDEDNQIKWFISEFQELRNEINRRSKEQFVCLSVSILSLGTLIGILSQNVRAYYPIFFVISWIITVFGIVWIDNSKQIFLIGIYIREEIEKRISKFADSEDIIGWENYLHVYRKDLNWKRKTPSLIISYLPIIFFIIPSILLILSYIFLRLSSDFVLDYYLPIYIEISLLVIGFILIIGLYISWTNARSIVLK